MTAYHHGNLRAELTRTAVDLAREAGPDGVVIREVARRTGVSHNAAYRHFRDRDDLLAAAAEGGQRELGAAMAGQVAGLADDDHPGAATLRLREIGRAYVHFALAEPGLFRTAFCLLPMPSEAASPEVRATDPYSLLGAVLDRMVAVGAMPEARRNGAEVLCWASVHGFAVLCLDGPLVALPPEQREQQLDLMLDTIEAGLRSPA